MQSSGTLRKRKKRNLAKVTGLGIIPYNERMDTYNGHDLFSRNELEQDFISPFAMKTENDTRLRFSASQMGQYRSRETSSRSRNRVTRDPSFHSSEYDDSEYDREIIFTAISSVELGPLDKRRHVDSSIKDRSRFIDRHAMQRLKQIIWLGITSGTFPWKWNEKEYRIEKWNPLTTKFWWIQWALFLTQTTILTCYQFHSFLQSFNTATTFRPVFMGSYCFLWYSYAVVLDINFYFYSEKMRNYINTMFQFNHVNVQNYLIHLDKFHDGGRLIINVACITNFIEVGVSVVLFLTGMHQPWYLFSYIYPKPFYWVIPFAVQDFMMVGHVLSSYLLIAWIVVAHCNTTNFWLQESHNHNDTDYTSDELRNPRQAMEMYRYLQVLNKLYNECMAPFAVPLMKVIIFTAMVPCGYVLVRTSPQMFIDEFPGILTYPLGIVDCFLVAFLMLAMFAQVFDLGCSFIDSWSRTKQKDFRRLLMSCSSMKMWVGRFYFSTCATTVTYCKMCVDYIINCIITFP